MLHKTLTLCLPYRCSQCVHSSNTQAPMAVSIALKRVQIFLALNSGNDITCSHSDRRHNIWTTQMTESLVLYSVMLSMSKAQPMNCLLLYAVLYDWPTCFTHSFMQRRFASVCIRNECYQCFQCFWKFVLLEDGLLLSTPFSYSWRYCLSIYEHHRHSKPPNTITPVAAGLKCHHGHHSSLNVLPSWIGAQAHHWCDVWYDI